MARRLYEVVFGGTFLNQQWLMRYNYVSSDVQQNVQGSAALARWLVGSDFLPGIPGFTLNPSSMVAQTMAVVSNASVMNSLSVFNVYDPVDFYSSPIAPGFTGGVGGAPASPALTYKFRTNTVRRDIRPGQKALGGLSEDCMGAGGTLEPDRRNALNALAAKMSEAATVTVGGVSIIFAPCIVSKEKYNVPNSGTPPRQAYRYYAAGVVAQLERIAEGITWSVVPTIRTQTSRQFGRGV